MPRPTSPYLSEPCLPCHDRTCRSLPTLPSLPLLVGSLRVTGVLTDRAERLIWVVHHRVALVPDDPDSTLALVLIDQETHAHVRLGLLPNRNDRRQLLLEEE